MRAAVCEVSPLYITTLPSPASFFTLIVLSSPKVAPSVVRMMPTLHMRTPLPMRTSPSKHTFFKSVAANSSATITCVQDALLHPCDSSMSISFSVRFL